MVFDQMSSVLVIRVIFVVLSWNFLPTSQYLIAETDRLALFSFKNQISDPLGALSSWNESSHCSNWTGVTCSNRHPSRVTMLVLQSMGLVGSISPDIGNLSFLKVLALSDNHFGGKIPQEIGRLFRLQYLLLQNNTLTGKIPRNLTSCKELVRLALSENKLLGKIPVEFGSFSKLKTLLLSGNNLKGVIPVSLSNLSALNTLTLGFNNLHGKLPSELGKLSTLEFFQLSGNRLSGTIPPQLLNISSITVFYATNNVLHGSIPPNIGITLPNLQLLGLGANRFYGLLPSSISNFSKLVRLDVSENEFTGGMPANLGTLHDLSYLNFQMNLLGNHEGDDLSFLNSLSNCSRLEFLSIGSNNLTGKLPESIANFSIELTRLSIQGNNIFGEIPPGIGNLVNLTGLGMDDNQLTGGIPVSVGKLSNLVSLTMSNNHLSGKIPSTICNNGSLLETLGLHRNGLKGTIPASLGNCGKLNVLKLSGNQLFGKIPKELFRLSSILYVLDLSENNLTGNLPSEVGKLGQLNTLNLSNNRLFGNIPISLGKCLGLLELYLQGNLFEGSIPSSLKNLKGILQLDLSRNNFSGQIPGYLESFDPLGFLNLSSNDLEGEVPVQGIFSNENAFSVLGNDKLCGGIPALQLPSCPKSGSKKLPLKRLLLIIFGVIICVIFSGLFVVWLWRRKKPITSSYSSLRTPAADKFQTVSYNELLKATDGFSTANLLGVGNYGSVYNGLLILNQEAPSVVAVKVLDLQRRGASKSFLAECSVMTCIRHRNLVKLLTSCSSFDYKGNEFKALVSEFMPNGNLENWLHPTANEEQLQRSARRSLSFMERLNIAIDVASALDYLHRDCQTPIVHCDLKPSNVLLDDDMNAHVGDFGLAKFLGGVIVDVDSEHHTNSTSVGIRGSIGYAAPEYGMGSGVSTNGDVYSYGIMVLELFTGKRPTDGMFTDGLSLHTFAETALLQDRVMQIVDPTVLLAPVHPQDDDDDDNNNEIPVDSTRDANLQGALSGIISLGVACSIESPTERMEMVQVLKELQSIKITHLSRLGSE